MDYIKNVKIGIYVRLHFVNFFVFRYFLQLKRYVLECSLAYSLDLQFFGQKLVNRAGDFSNPVET